VNIERALAISDYQCDERTAEVTWLAQQASTRLMIVEVGCWKGCTTRAMADNTKGTVFAVDTWLGSFNEVHKEFTDHEPGWLFEEFMRNVDDLKNRQVVKLDSLSAAMWLGNRGYKFDMIFLDASHDYDSVKADILAWRPLLASGGLLCGHDRQWDGVAQAINELLPNHRTAVGAIWYAL
jgi:methyltransferase family protein